MALVMDASIALAWSFDDEDSSTAERVISTVLEEGAVVPEIWRFEVANALVTSLRRGRVTEGDLPRLTELLGTLPVAVSGTSWSDLFGPVSAFARTHGLSAYDAAYLHLAMREALPLATLDARLQSVARSLGCAVVG